MNRRRLALSLSLALAAAAPARALAAHPAQKSPAAQATSEAAPNADERAAEWMAKGNKAFREGKFAEAERAYREALSLKKGHDIAGNLGAALLAQGKRAEAAQHLAFTLRAFPITGDPAQRAQMQKAFDEAKKGLGRLHISADTPGARVTVDGALAGESPLADEVFVDPGEHLIEASLEGRAAASQRARVAADASADVSLSLALLTPADKPAGATPRRSLIPGLALAGLSAVGIGGGVAFITLSLSKRSDAVRLGGEIRGAQGSCVEGAGNYDARCSDLQSKLRADDTYHNTAVASFVIGGAAAAGAALYLFWPQKRAAAARITPLVGAGLAGALVTGSF